MNPEYVLCIPRATLAGFGLGRGFTPFGGGPIYWQGPGPLLNAAHTLLPRDAAETDDRYKQIIVYCIIELEPPVPHLDVEVFTYRRRGGCEGRLRGRLSIGVGGHINADDCSGSTGRPAVVAGIMRELTEEVVLTPHGGSGMEWLGVIDDDSDEVGRVHLGVVARVKSWAPVRPAQDGWDQHGMCRIGAFSHPDLWGRCESWTRILLRDLYGIRPGA